MCSHGLLTRALLSAEARWLPAGMGETVASATVVVASTSWAVDGLSAG
ncbi:hypothetical protein STRTUCAR8_09960 [Streptomyces turgidiscabies Car8]|uniref:Uncharacterized protein n=1 Tax=Streptomyces turgidiscabies (strain Car8) TaxID=698760 RepID=L7EQX7_STRT8|nr:hypothetical protein STRTUCAR8_09960 [Streptomyces turgidiscabies Car8]